METRTGSAVIYNNGQLGINNCTFTHNSGVLGGVINSLQKLTMNDCTFTNNQALNGGAAYLLPVMLKLLIATSITTKHTLVVLF